MTREVGFGNPSSETPSTNIVIMAGTSEMDGIRPPSRPQYDGEYIPSDVYRPIYPRQSHYEIAGMNSDGFASDATYDSCDSQSSVSDTSHTVGCR